MDLQSRKNVDGTIKKFKARLVVMGYLQVFRIDYYDSFTPVTKVVTMRVHFSIATQNNWHVHQMNIKNAFLHEKLDEELYLILSEGLNVFAGQVCKLDKTLYGLKQIIRQWLRNFQPNFYNLDLNNPHMTIVYSLCRKNTCFWA